MVSYFRPNDLQQCVRSILTNTREPYHLSIIDNSHGKIDAVLDSFANQHITIYKNKTNIGKGRAFMVWYHEIMKQNTATNFVSIDSDIIVQPDWLTQMEIAYHRLSKHRPAILAPTIITNIDDNFQKQLKRGKLVMHRHTNNSHMVNGVYKNRYTSGPLLLINKQFFESVGGYNQTQLYGNEDGELCKSAAKQNRFIGIVPEVNVFHSNTDSDIGYKEWKKKNVNKDVDQQGYWDQ